MDCDKQERKEEEVVLEKDGRLFMIMMMRIFGDF
jgi:hypothetical protein